MTREDIRKLIGGYATNSLTEAERKMLFEAALEDQELFDELAQEQALKEWIEEPGAKPRLIAALETDPKSVAVAWWRRPWPWLAAIAALAAGAVLITMLLPRPVKRAGIAEVKQPVPQVAPAIPPAVAESAQPVRRQPSHARKAREEEASGKVDALTPPPAMQQAAESAAASPRAPQQVQQQFLGGKGGGGGGAVPLSGTLNAAKADALEVPRFALQYTLEPGGYLSIKVAGDGYLLVSATSSSAIHVIPLAENGHVLSGSTTRLKLPENTQEITITFAARPADDRTGLGSAIAGLVLSKDSPSGAIEDPHPSTNSKIVVTVHVK